MKSSLAEYLDAMDGSFGCVKRYEESVIGAGQPTVLGVARLAGHYAHLLQTLVDLIGRDRARRLVAVHDEIDEVPS